MPSDPSDSGLGAGLAQTAYPEVAPGQWNSAAQAWQLPPAVTTVVHPSQPLSDDRLFDLGVISPEEYQRRTGRLSPYTGLQSGLFPRAQSALNNDSPYLQQAVGAGMDLASLPGRAYASLGSLPNESYGQALARVSSPDSAEKAYQITDNMFRDPSTALIPLGLGLAGKLPAVASGINALGTAGRVGLDAAANTAAQMANEYGTTGTTSNPLGSGLMNAAMDVGVRGMGGLGSKLARMVSPEESAANFKRWLGDSKVVDEAGKPLIVYHGMPPKFETINGNRELSQEERAAYLREGMAAHSKAKDAIKAIGVDENTYQSLPKEQRDALDAIYASRNLESDAIASKYGQGIPYKIEQLNGVNQLEGAAFDPMRSGDVGTHFSESPEVASRFAKSGSVYPTYLSGDVIDMPDVFSRYHGLSDAVEAFRDAGVISNKDAARLSRMASKADMISFPDERDWGASKDVLKFWEGAKKASAGSKKIIRYDNTVEGGGKSYAVFDPTQIKSAIGNRGTWDPSDPNITHFAPGLSAGAFPNFATLLGNRVNNTARQAVMQQGQQTFGGQQ